MKPDDRPAGSGISMMSGPGAGGPPPGYYGGPPQDPWYPQQPADPYLGGAPQDPWAGAPQDPYGQGGYHAPQDPYAASQGGWYSAPQGQPPVGWTPPPPPAERDRGGGGIGAVVVGAFLVLLGLWFIFRDQVGVDLVRVWPAVAVGLGVLMVLAAFLPRRGR